MEFGGVGDDVGVCVMCVETEYHGTQFVFGWLSSNTFSVHKKDILKLRSF